MNPTFRLGRVAGVEVAAHWSVLAIWWLLGWSLSTAFLPDQAPGHGAAAYWATGLVAATVFLACLLAHEVGHAAVARSHGVETEIIVLWLFGGVAQMADESPDPRTELRVAGVGPVVSIGLGVVFGVITAGLDGLGGPRLLVGAFLWLALINVIIGGFNLLPAFPLDGGRVLRAVLWRRGGDRNRATQRAAQAGRVFAYGMIALGILNFTAGFLGGLWYVFIGWFLLMAATAEAERSGMSSALESTRVADLMSRDPDVAPSWLTVEELLDDFVLRLRHSTLPLLDRGGGLVGMVTLRGIKAVPPTRRHAIRADQIMIPVAEVPSVSPDQSLAELLAALSRAGDGRALVHQDGRLVGIVTPTDVARSLELAELASH